MASQNTLSQNPTFRTAKSIMHVLSAAAEKFGQEFDEL